MKRTLTLRRETLTELTGADLALVAGAAAQASGITYCPLTGCVDELTTVWPPATYRCPSQSGC